MISLWVHYDFIVSPVLTPLWNTLGIKVGIHREANHVSPLGIQYEFMCESMYDSCMNPLWTHMWIHLLRFASVSWRGSRSTIWYCENREFKKEFHVVRFGPARTGRFKQRRRARRWDPRSTIWYCENQEFKKEFHVVRFGPVRTGWFTQGRRDRAPLAGYPSACEILKAH